MKELKVELKIILGVLISALLIALTIFIAVNTQNAIKQGRYIGQGIEPTYHISVSDKAEIYAKPNLALIDFSVVTEGKTPEKTMEDNTLKMNKVIEAVKELGVEEKDIKTTQFTITPRYEYTREPYRQNLIGYRVTQTLSVKIRNFDKIGEIIESAVEQGANQVGDLQFTIDNQDELKRQARKQAIEKAKEKAKQIASDLGVSLGRIIEFRETSETPIVYPRLELTEKALGSGGIEEGAQIQPGENKIEVSVTITYEIN